MVVHHRGISINEDARGISINERERERFAEINKEIIVELLGI